MLLTKVFKSILIGNTAVMVVSSLITARAESFENIDKTLVDKDLQRIQRSLNELNADIDKIQEMVISSQKIKNLVSVSLKNNLNNLYLVRNINFYLDNNLVYSASDDLGFWSASAEVPILFGPLAPGQHSGKIVVVVRVSEESQFALDENVEKKYENEFSLLVPEVDVKLNYVVTLGGDDERKGVAFLNVEKTSLP